MSQTEQVKRVGLLFLPNELLERVFEEIHPLCLPNEPICKGLLASQQKALYHQLYAERYGYPDCTRIDEDDFVGFLEHLVELRELNLCGGKYLVELALSPKVTSLCLPKLHTFRISCSLSCFHDPFHPIFYLALAYFNNVRKLFFGMHRRSLSITIAYPAKPFQSHSFALTNVKFTGKLSARGGFPHLLASLPNLTRLFLSDTSPSPNLEPLLQHLPCPAKITDVPLDAKHAPSANDLYRLFAPFHRAGRLGVGFGFTSSSLEFVSVLRDLPLVEVVFIEAATTDPSSLLTLSMLTFLLFALSSSTSALSPEMARIP
ncbi:hypothetical protein JCM8547_003350 [Rhodosporidiobolus lusitaniae]